jgi:hypothetical protein
LKEQINNKTLELYIDKLISSYGLYPTINEAGLRIQFEHNLYAECVLSVMRYFKLNNKVKVVCYADHLYPCKDSFAKVHLPCFVPIYGTDQFNRLKITVEMRETGKKHFYAFIRSLSHELAHIILHSTRHDLHQSEIATELCTLVFGFSDFMRKGSIYKIVKNGELHRCTIGYLTEDQIRHSTQYIECLRKNAAPPKTIMATVFDSVINFFDGIFK